MESGVQGGSETKGKGGERELMDGDGEPVEVVAQTERKRGDQEEGRVVGRGGKTR